jgi:hypothetical protein
MTAENDDEIEAELSKTAKKSHAAIDDAIRQHMTDLGITGVGTGWVLLVSITDFDETGEVDGIFDTHSDGLSKWAKTGLLSFALSQQNSEGYF